MTKYPPVACYLRVSTQLQGFEAQSSAVVSFCQRSGLKLGMEYEIYEEKVAGSGKARPVLEGILSAARRGEVKIVVVWKLDRLGRSSQHLSYVCDELSRFKCDLISITEGIDTRTVNPGATLQINVLKAFAEFERGIIRERSMAGQEAARAAGKHVGRPGTSEAIRQQILSYADQVKSGAMSHQRVGEICRVSRMTVGRVLAQNSPPKKQG